MDASLLQHLRSIGIDETALVRDATAIVLFGSRAAGCAHAGSDWDLLCVGSGRTRMVRGLDLIWVSEAHVASSEWVGSELANHVAHYGRPLLGQVVWPVTNEGSDLALARKHRQLAGHLRGMLRVWPSLNAIYRRRQLASLRRDLQRHSLLQVGGVVPPTAILDRYWSRYEDPNERLLELARASGLCSLALEQVLVEIDACVPIG